AATFEIQGLSLSTLYNNLEKLNAKSTTVILEACFTGASPNGFLIKNASPLFNPEYPDLLTGRNLTVYAASQDNQLASWLPDKSNGLFTHYFLKAMRGEADQQYVGNNDGKVSNAEIREYLHHTMSYEAKRHYGRTQVAMIPNEPASWTTETE
ncbi:MAG: caspase family protein, partial [Alphaproteobacteria bacterium]|nr:caspase family protein [Alphaproteobacteria bacterium]